MMFNGTNVAGQTTSVVAGQEIMFTGQAPSEECVAATVSQKWSLPLENGKPTKKNAVGGYVVGPNASTEDPSRPQVGAVTPLPTDTTTTSYGPFYFTSPGTYTLTYQYTFNIDGASKTSPVSTATFTVDGPTDVSVLTCGGDVDLSTGCTANGPLGTVNIGTFDGSPYLQFGGTATNVGIAFTASAATAPSGSFTWVQFLTKDVITWTPSSGGAVLTCYLPELPTLGVFPALDNLFPYDSGGTVNDNPGTGLPSGFKKINMAFSAEMNLMWTPTADPGCADGDACTIPVPFGYVNWKVSATAKLNKSGTWVPSGNWSAREFVASSSYPTWTSWVENGQITCH
jgi:hypothetical protein